jgi:hypothetical protein
LGRDGKLNRDEWPEHRDESGVRRFWGVDDDLGEVKHGHRGWVLFFKPGAVAERVRRMAARRISLSPVGRRAPPSAFEITADIARTRERMSRSLVRLDRNYALRRLFVSAEHLLVDRDSDIADGVPIAITAIGLGWIAYGDRDGGARLRASCPCWVPLKNLAKESGPEASAQARQ